MGHKFNNFTTAFTREVFHEILFLISLSLSLLMFWGLGNWIVASIVFALFGFALEVEKRFLSRKVKRLAMDKQWNSLLANMSVLIIIVGLSLIASYGSMKSSIVDKILMTEELNEITVEEIDVDNVNFQIEQIDAKIERLNNAIAITQTEQVKMNNWETAVFIPSMEKMDDITVAKETEIAELLEDRTELSNLLKKVDNFEENKTVNFMSSSGTFKMIAEDFGWDLENVMTIILYLLVSVLELSLFLTVTPLDSDKEVKQDERELFENFVNSMFDNGGKKYLNSDNKVSSMTGISVGQCKKWRSLIAENIRMRGNRPLIEKEKSGWTSSFPVSTVLKVATKSLFMEEE